MKSHRPRVCGRWSSRLLASLGVVLAACALLLAAGSSVFAAPPSEPPAPSATWSDRAEVVAADTLGPWHMTIPISAVRYYLEAVANGNDIYVLGSQSDNPTFLASVEKTTVQDNGSLTSWQYLAPMTMPRQHFGAAVANGYIYAVGGRSEWVHQASVGRTGPDGHCAGEHTQCPGSASGSHRHLVGL